MFRVFLAAACLLAAVGGAQAAACDLEKEDKEITQLMSASTGMTEKALESIMVAIQEVDALIRRNNTGEACEGAARIKAMIPK